MLDQFIQDATRETTVPGRVAALETVAALLVKVKNPTTRELYARHLTVVLEVTPQQVTRALRAAQESVNSRDQRGRQDGRIDSTDASADGVNPPLVERALPRDERELLALMATYPELAGTTEAKRAGDLLVDPAARQMFRSARDALAEAGRLDVPTWLENGPPDVRRSLAAALMDEGISRAGNPATSLRALVARLELQRVEAEISMTARLLEQARSRGDSKGTDEAMRRGIELDKTKQGLKSALQRP
jgi:DNA primase